VSLGELVMIECSHKLVSSLFIQDTNAAHDNGLHGSKQERLAQCGCEQTDKTLSSLFSTEAITVSAALVIKYCREKSTLFRYKNVFCLYSLSGLTANLLCLFLSSFFTFMSLSLSSSLKSGVLRRQPHGRSGLVTLPSVGAVP